MKLQNFLEFHLARMQECFNITHFDVEIHRDQITSAMEICVDYEYLDADIAYGKQAILRWKRGDKIRILKWLAHELTHIITGELKTNHKKTERTFYDERATEHLSRLLFRLYRREYRI